jgi:hypothetical protein
MIMSNLYYDGGIENVEPRIIVQHPFHKMDAAGEGDDVRKALAAVGHPVLM